MVEEAWDRLEAWCRAHVPGLLDALNPGASAAEIEALERAIQRPLPADVRVSLAIHNGQSGRPLGSDFVFGLELLDAEQIAHYWELWAGLTEYNDEYREDMASVPPGAIQLDYANPGWVPLTKAASASHLATDLAPGPAGSVGQMINFGRDEREKCVLAASWGEFLLSYAKFLESDAFRVIHPEAHSWDVNFEPVFNYVSPDGEEYIRHQHATLIDWRKQGRWPLR
jgi:cell wall assembly regulator SMI1